MMDSLRDHATRIPRFFGQAVGTTTARGERPKDRPLTVPQVLSTLYHAVGIDPGNEVWALCVPN